MRYRDVTCENALKKITRPDALFHGQYTVDPYQNCAFGCLYCDSALEPVDVKINIADVLARELQDVPRGRVILGSVHDPYQPVEERTGLSRAVLSALRDHGFSCHILTKSPLVLRDLPLIVSFDCAVTVSLLSVNARLAQVFEPAVVSPQERLVLVRLLRDVGVTAGVAVLPVLPLFAEPDLEATVAAVADAHAAYLLFKHLELKGEQRDRFIEILQSKYPRLVAQYQRWYEHAISPDHKYLESLTARIETLSQRYQLENKMPEDRLR